MSLFEIFETNNSQYCVLVKNQDKIEFITEKYDSKSRAIESINKIRKNAQRHDSYKFVELECGSWLFQLYDMSRNILLGQSQTYINKEIIEKKVKEMRILVPFAKFKSLMFSIKTIL